MDSPEPALPEDAVGRRVLCGGDRATVRFVGEVPPTKGLWLGVEWDNPERGKHDGVHEGVQYFTCTVPGSGSFVRPSKVSFGVDFLKAVEQMYHIDTEEVLSEDISISSKKLQWDKVQERSFESLPSIILNRCDVCGPGAQGQIRSTTPNVQWLDLSRTLIGRWDDVAAIAEQMEVLEGLQLSYNRLAPPSDPELLSGAFLRLTALALNECALCWTQVLHYAPMWPQLEDLSLDGNNISTITNPGTDLFQSLKSLSLSQNPLDQDSVLVLSSLPRLQTLNLSETGLSSLHFPDSGPGEDTQMFPSLKNLNLDQNRVSEWRVVNELGRLRALEQFSCRGNPLKSSDGNHRTCTQLLIAKLPRVSLLNGTKVEAEDRRGAELDYIKLFGEEWLKAGGRSQLSPDFIRDHPRYQALVQKYGAPEDGELKKPQPFALKNQLLKISFVFPDDAERKRVVKKLPASMELQKVKGLLHRLLKVPPTDLRLSYSSPKMVGTEFQLDNDLKSLQFYSIEDGDTVLVRWS